MEREDTVNVNDRESDVFNNRNFDENQRFLAQAGRVSL
jgi:hypothetical protein